MDSEPSPDIAAFAARHSRRAQAAKARKYTFRQPDIGDGADLWRLVRASGVLELNSAYCYLMMADHFGDTCLIAERRGKPVGLVIAFLEPRRPDTIFVWQIGVASSERGRGLGTRLLLALLEKKACAGVRFLESTVTASNRASITLFTRLARRLGTACRVSKGYGVDHFPDSAHEAEALFRIGPIGTRT